MHPNLAEVYRRKVAELGVALRDPDSGAEALSILRGLVEKVTVTPAEDHFAIELEGALAGMLALACSNGTAPGSAAVSEVFRRSVKVVAGARSHLYRTAVAMPFKGRFDVLGRFLSV